MPGPLGIGAGGGGGGGTVTAVSGSAPISVANGTTTPAISVTASTPGAVTGGATASAGTIANGVAAADHVHSTSNLALLNGANTFTAGQTVSGDLTVSKNVSGGVGPSIFMLNANGGVGAGASIEMSGYAAANPATVRIQSLDDGAYSSSLRIYIKQTGAGATAPVVERLTILPTGYIGINTASPTQALHVTGNGIVSGTLTVGGNAVLTTASAVSASKVLSFMTMGV